MANYTWSVLGGVFLYFIFHYFFLACFQFVELLLFVCQTFWTDRLIFCFLYFPIPFRLPLVFAVPLVLLLSHSGASDSLWPHGLQHARLPCLPLAPGVCTDSRPFSWWCHPWVTINPIYLLIPRVTIKCIFFSCFFLTQGYLPANVDRRPATLQRKQKEYFAFIDHYYDSRNDEVHQDTYRQVGTRFLFSCYWKFFHLVTSLLVEVLYLAGPWLGHRSSFFLIMVNFP